ncbi:UNVERIFIED_CONTAM: glycine betaine/proline transport system substrate-binding protein [Acetivibrio alkalicellulosi]
MKGTRSILLIGIALGLVLLGGIYAYNYQAARQEENRSVTLTYVEWSTEVASTNVVRAVLQERMGYDVEIIPVSASAMWQSLTTGDSDAMVAAWLPTTHEEYYNQVIDQVDNLGPNLDGTKIGLVVPEYVEINSIEELNDTAEMFESVIIGIDPGAGLMSATEEVMSEYELTEFLLIEGTGATMTAALADRISNEEWIVVTGWTPHWKFSKWDLKYLEDPKEIYGGDEQIYTIVRRGLDEDMPEVYNFLDKFYWTTEDMETVMGWNEEDGADPYENAKRWIEENKDRVDEWLS